MTHQVLIASYLRDFPWLEHCLRTLRHFSRGFLPPVVCVSSEDRDGARKIADECFPETTIVVRDGPHGNLRAQIAMMSGDILCPEADYVWLVGSDCIAVSEFSPEPYFHEGRPVMLYNSFECMATNHPGTMPWQVGVENVLGFWAPNETMRRIPLVYPKALFAKVRRAVERQHGQRFEDFVYGYGAAGFSDFSESNILGAWAWRHEPELYHWVCLDDAYTPESWGQEVAGWPNAIVQFWSHGGLDKPCDARYRYFGGITFDKTPQSIIDEVYASMKEQIAT